MPEGEETEVSAQRALGFKYCPMCELSWGSRDEFLSDRAVELLGYQVNFGDLLAGHFLFNHSCGDTLSIEAGEFADLHDGPVFRERATGTEACPGHCLRKNDLEPCKAQCECVFVRDILQAVRNWPKSA
jgi:hypothetical protein